VDELVEADPFVITTTMKNDTSRDIVLFQEDFGAHTVETTPMSPRIDRN
jgi:hypothetical protein